MGCDIHVFLEKKDGDKWLAVQGPNPYYGKWDGESELTLEGWLFDGRNYNLFSILADVRNNCGAVPISMPRGVPEDASMEITKESECIGCDGHTHSWYTLKELLEFNWDNSFVENEAYVSEEVYKQFKNGGGPYPCCGDISGPKIEKILNYEMDRVIKNKYPWEINKQFYTAIKWKTSYKDIADNMLESINKYIEQQSISNSELDDYRIVFWFDN